MFNEETFLDLNLVDDVIKVVWRLGVILGHHDGRVLRGLLQRPVPLASQGLQLILWCLGLEQDK